ncbi:CHASE domain-containing protein [Novosphingobium sp.]|uniref:CHASE domain-containing protein n=1 Tax=Novosphingobium sp. TaxID=1874826 RepID=UPI0025DF3109|nr:CHASE domain-containing protein [Novosphingobium sp.]
MHKPSASSSFGAKPSGEHPHRWYERYPRALPVGVFALTLGVTAISVAAVEHAEDGREAAQLSQTTASISSAIERRAGSSAMSLRAGAALIATQTKFDPATFGLFIDQLGQEGRASGAEGIGWVARVDPGQESAFAAEVRASGVPGFAIRPDGAAQGGMDRYVVRYLRPATPRNNRAIGFDMASERVRREAMMSAAQFGRPTASGKIVLVQEDKATSPPGFVLFMPVYSSAAMGHHLRGFVYTPFNARAFLASSVDIDRMSGVGFALYDGDAAPANLLYQRALAGGPVRTETRHVVVADRSWTLVVSIPDGTLFSPVSLMTLLFGLLVATLLLVLARLVTQQASEDRTTLEWFEQQSSIRNSLVRELNHRVKNTLANVLSILALTRGRATDLDSFAQSLDGRVRALSATHDLLTQSDWGSTSIRALIEAEMAPYVRDQSGGVTLSGDPVMLAPNDALSLGMAIHELATNAAKYGALSVEAGRVSIAWRMVTAQIAQLDWAESGGPTLDPVASRKRGFGTELIQKIVAHELKHPVELEFLPGGVRCRLMVAVREGGNFAMREQKPG